MLGEVSANLLEVDEGRRELQHADAVIGIEADVLVLGINQQVAPIDEARVERGGVDPTLVAHDARLDDGLESRQGRGVHPLEGVRIQHLLIHGKGLGGHRCRSDGIRINRIVNLLNAGVKTVLTERRCLHLAKGDDGVGPLQIFALNQEQTHALLLAHSAGSKGLQLAVKRHHEAQIVLQAAAQGLELHHLVGTMNVDDVGLHVARLLIEGLAVVGHLYVGALL